MLWTNHRKTSYIMTPHRHDMHEFFICLNDKAIQHAEGRQCNFRRGRAFLLYSGCRHHVEFIPGVPAEFMFVCFDANHLAEAGFLKLQEQLQAGRRKAAFFSCDDPEYLRFNVRTMRMLHETVTSPGLLQEELANALLTQLLIAFFRNIGLGAADSATTDDKRKRVVELCRRLAANPAIELTLDTAAAKAGICRSAFAASVKETTGFTWREYVLDCRLKKAVKLLEETDLPITDIALSCSFNNIGYFYRTFRAKFALTPAKLRQKLCVNRFPSLLKEY